MGGDLQGRRLLPVLLGPGTPPAVGTVMELDIYLLYFIHDLSKGGSCFFYMNNLCMVFPHPPTPPPHSAVGRHGGLLITVRVVSARVVG